MYAEEIKALVDLLSGRRRTPSINKIISELNRTGDNDLILYLAAENIADRIEHKHRNEVRRIEYDSQEDRPVRGRTLISNRDASIRQSNEIEFPGAESEFENAVRAAVAAHAVRKKMIWTEELLAARVKINGEYVAWGEATIAQHESRYEESMKLATGNAATAAKHRQAIADLQAADVDTLYELVATNAA